MTLLGTLSQEVSYPDGGLLPLYCPFWPDLSLKEKI